MKVECKVLSHVGLEIYSLGNIFLPRETGQNAAGSCFIIKQLKQVSTRIIFMANAVACARMLDSQSNLYFLN